MDAGARKMRPLRALPLALLLALAAIGGRLGESPAAAENPSLSLRLVASPAQVDAGDEVLYTLTVTNSAASDGSSPCIQVILPDGFQYVTGSAGLAYDGAAAPLSDPSETGQTLTWTPASLPGARTESPFGIHTFVQDAWSDTAYQLDRVRELMGPGAFVKQLCYRITPATSGPDAAWVSFVNGCYDRGLVPVIRLAGNYDGGAGYWAKPVPPYDDMAQAFRRVVAGLPRRYGHLLYIEIWNEPNLDLEWGGQANPTEYAQFLVAASAAIRSLGDARIVVMNGGLSPGVAYSAGGGYDWLGFIDGMASVPGALEAFDVWASHAYPGNRPPEQNLHAGNVTGYHELTVDAFRLELERLALYGRSGVDVLITETGYALGACDFCAIYGLPQIEEANRAEYVVRAYRDWWSSWPELRGVCPYQLQDPNGDWDEWDWIGHQQYDAVRAMNKSVTPAARVLTLTFRATAPASSGTFTCDASVATGNLGSASLSEVAPVTVSLQPTPTPVPPGQCTELIDDGSFEGGAWQILSTAYEARYTTTPVRNGEQALQAGILDEPPVVSYSSAQQTVTVPQTDQEIILTFWYWPLAELSTAGLQYVVLLDGEGQAIEYLMWQRSNAQAWTLAEYDLSSYAGQTLTLRFGAHNSQANVDAGLSTALVVDDVSLQVCGASLVPQGDPRVYLPHVMRQPTLSLTAMPAATMQALSEVSVVAVGSGQDSQRVLEPLFDLGVQGTGQPATDVAYDETRKRLVAAIGARVRVWDLGTREQIWVRRLPAEPYRVMVRPADGSVYAVLPSRGEVHRFAPDGRLLAVGEGLGRPVAFALVRGRLWVADAEQRRLVLLDGSSLQTIHSLRLPGIPGALAYVADMDRVFVSLHETGHVLALDEATLEPVGMAQLGGVGLVSDLVAAEGTSSVYATHALSGRYGGVSVLDADAVSVSRTLWGNPERTLLGANALVVDAARGSVILRESGAVRVLDAVTLEETDRITGASYGMPGALALDSASGTAFLSDSVGRLWVYGFQGALP
ncbi:MAG: hypothetical protein ACP5G7_02770 [Anaerolineae bacterium]